MGLKKEGSSKDYLLPFHSYLKKVESNLQNKSLNSSMKANNKNNFKQSSKTILN